MDRKQFLGNLFSLAVLASIPKTLKDIAPNIDKPGIGASPFKIKLAKGWFHSGDIIQMSGQLGKQFHYQLIDNKRAVLTEVSNSENRITIEVEFFDLNMSHQARQARYIEHLAQRQTEYQKICNTVPGEA
jgi:hypothetical protein